MNTDPLIAAFNRADQATPDDMPGALRALPPVGTLPSSWATWTLIELVHRRRRQSWARNLVRKSDLDRVIKLRLDEDGRPRSDLQPVRGAPRWSYELSTDCGFSQYRLANRDTREVLTV